MGEITLGSFTHITEALNIQGCMESSLEALRMHPCPAHHPTLLGEKIGFQSLHMTYTGYKNLFKMDIPGKTLENSYLVRAIWIIEKNFLSRNGEREGCSSMTHPNYVGIEKITMHLTLFPPWPL
jgi:hypothetical protein